MNNLKIGYFAIVAIVVFASVGVSQATGPQTVLFYTSSPTSWVGQGQTRTINPTAEGFTVQAMRYFDAGARTNGIEFNLVSSTESFILDFVGPNQTLATGGSYPNATRFPFQ